MALLAFAVGLTLGALIGYLASHYQYAVVWQKELPPAGAAHKAWYG